MCQQIIQTVKYADDLVLMAKEETVLQGMIDKLIEIGRQMNVGKKSNENFKITIPSNNYDRPKTTGECGIFLGSMLTNDGRCTCEIKSRIAIANTAFNKKKTLFTSTLDINLGRN